MVAFVHFLLQAYSGLNYSHALIKYQDTLSGLCGWVWWCAWLLCVTCLCSAGRGWGMYLKKTTWLLWNSAMRFVDIPLMNHWCLQVSGVWNLFCIRLHIAWDVGTGWVWRGCVQCSQWLSILRYYSASVDKDVLATCHTTEVALSIAHVNLHRTIYVVCEARHVYFK